MKKLDQIKTDCLQGVFFQKLKIIKKLKLQKQFRAVDKYVGWFARTVWSRSIPIEERKIVFLTFNKQYTCNPKYICEEILRRGLDYDLVWLTVEDGGIQGCAFPACVRRVKIGSVAAYRELLSAKIIVQNAHSSQEYGYIPKKQGQYSIQTWHGSLGIKRFDPSSDSIKSRVSAAIRAGKLTDIFLSNSTFETREVAPVYWGTSEVCEWGHARNDILIKPQPEKIIKFRREFLLPDSVRAALYAPTFRDSKDMAHYRIDYEKMIEALERRFGGKWVVMVKFHYSNRKTAHLLQDSDRVMNVSAYADIQELMLVADVGITDYSSWIFDYMLTRRPAFLYAEDIDDYEVERGFYYPLNTTPFPIATSTDELCDRIANFDEEKYRERVESFLRDKGCVEDGAAAARAVDRIEQVVGTKRIGMETRYEKVD